MPTLDAMTEHILWCAEQALAVWNAYFPGDHRPRQALELYRVYLKQPGDMKVMMASMRASDAAFEAAEQVEAGTHSFANLAASYAARTIACCGANARTTDVMRDIRAMMTSAITYHTLVVHQKNGGSPQELVSVESQAEEAVHQQQDNDLRQRMTP
jgi:hypothetical protein